MPIYKKKKRKKKKVKKFYCIFVFKNLRLSYLVDQKCFSNFFVEKRMLKRIDSDKARKEKNFVLSSAVSIL